MLKRSMPYTLPCVKQILIAGVKQLYSSRCSAQGSVMTKRAGVEIKMGGRLRREEIYV